MAGLILPYGLLKGGKKVVELVSFAMENDWGRSGDDPAPRTITIDPAAGQVLVVAAGGRVGTREGNPQDTDAELDGGGELFNTDTSDSQGKDDDIVGGSIAAIDGAATDAILTSRSVDNDSRADGYGYGAVVLSNASRFEIVDSTARCRDGGTYSLTVDVEKGGYVFAYAFIRGRTVAELNAGWAGVSALDAEEVGGTSAVHGIAGTEITADGELTVTLGSITSHGYLGVVSFRAT